MKKIIIALCCVLMAGVGYAQVDSAAMQRQQEELLRQQQLEQQQLIEQQQKEQERQLKEQQKEQEQALKAQAKEQAREQAELQAKQEKQMKKAERKAAINRNFYISLDPHVDYTVNTNVFNKTDLYHTGTMLWRGYRGDFNVGADIDFHIPLSKRANLQWGVGYALSRMAYTNDVMPNAAFDALVLNPNTTGYEMQYNAFAHRLEMPLLLSFTGKKDSTDWKEVYFGVRLGYTYAANFRTRSWDASNNAVVSPNIDVKNAFNTYQLKLVVGGCRKVFIFSPGYELYFNLLPTYVDANTSVREIGLIYKL